MINNKKHQFDFEEMQLSEYEEVEVNRISELHDIEFPLPTHKSILENGKYPYNTFATLMINSNYDSEQGKADKNYRNFLYENKMEDVMEFLKELELEGAKQVSRRTVERHIKTIIDLGFESIECRNTENGIVYMLKASTDDKYFIKIPYAQIRELLISTNKNMLKLFAFLKVMCTDKQGKIKDSFTTIDRKFLCEHIGLSSKSDTNVKKVGTMLVSLAKLGFIEIKKTGRNEIDEKGRKVYKTINSYRIRSFEEYKEITNRAKGY